MTTYSNFTQVVQRSELSTEGTRPPLFLVSDQSVVTRQRFTTESNNTGDDTKESDLERASPTNRIYPHVYDSSTNAGNVLVLIQQAIVDVERALDAFGEPDLGAVMTQLTNVAVNMRSAHSLIDFNRSLGGLVSYVRRATLVTPIENIQRSSLNALDNVLQAIHQNPMLDLDDASDLVEKLSVEGWLGEIDTVGKLITALLEDSENEELQAQLFPDAV